MSEVKHVNITDEAEMCEALIMIMTAFTEELEASERIVAQLSLLVKLTTYSLMTNLQDPQKGLDHFYKTVSDLIKDVENKHKTIKKGGILH